MRVEIDKRDPHAGLPALTEGPPPAEARLTLLLLHGRGASARDILTLARELRVDDVAHLAPQADGHTWYPYSFLAPIDQNEPGISSAFRVLTHLVDTLGGQGVETSR